MYFFFSVGQPQSNIWKQRGIALNCVKLTFQVIFILQFLKKIIL